jgi:hypothetical protein
MQNVTRVYVHIVVLWNVMPCNTVGGCGQEVFHEEGSSMFLSNVVVRLQHSNVPRPTGPQTKRPPQLKPSNTHVNVVHCPLQNY